MKFRIYLTILSLAALMGADLQAKGSGEREARKPSSELSEFERGYQEGKVAGLNAGEVIVDVRFNTESSGYVLTKLNNQCMGGQVTKVNCKDVNYHPIVRICTAVCVRR